MVVIGHDDVRLPVHGAFENSIVIRVSPHYAKYGARGDNMSDMGDNPNDFPNAIILPGKIETQNPSHLPDDCGRSHYAKQIAASGVP